MKNLDNLEMSLPEAEERPEVTEPIEDLDIDEALEAILFAAGHAMKYTDLASLFELSPLEMKARVLDYAQKYNNSSLSRGVMLLALDETCQLCTKSGYLPYIRAALGIRKNGSLSASSIETLAIIAYNQPVTRSYIDQVRKIDSSYAVGNLLDRGLIECRGRLDAPGRPMLFGTTPDFLRCFGLNSLTDLPDIHAEDAAALLQKIGQPYTIDEDQLTLDEELAEATPKTEEEPFVASEGEQEVIEAIPAPVEG